jgi:hypothetical protein
MIAVGAERKERISSAITIIIVRQKEVAAVRHILNAALLARG